jgi:hypothetical protein
MNSTRLSDILNVKKAEKKRKFLGMGIIVSGVLAIAFIVITFYGQYSGNFVINVPPESAERGIQLSIYEDFRSSNDYLTTAPLKDALDTTFTDLNLRMISSAEGDYIDPFNSMVAFTFWIKNTGKEMFDVDYYMKFQANSVYNNLDAAIRIMIVEYSNDGTDAIRHIFQKKDMDEISEVVNGEIVTRPKEEYYDFYGVPNGVDFIDELNIFKLKIERFTPQAQKKFSIVMWIEGWDPECTNDIRNGKFKAELTFRIAEGQSLM